MKKILSVVLVLAMVLALGTVAFAANTELEAGSKTGMAFEFDTTNGAKISDSNGILVFSELVILDGGVVVNVTVPAATKAGTITQIIITDKDGKNAVKYDVIEVVGPATPVAPPAEGVVNYVEGTTVLPDTTDAVIYMNGYNGISAAYYNALKSKNYETITFVGDDYAWTLTRGDYTKMNVTASIYFGVDVDNKLFNNKGERDLAKENAVLKALGTTQADVFFVTLSDNVNIANVASKPSLTVVIDGTWINYNNKFSVSSYKFDGEAVTKVAEGLAIKPTTNKLTLNLTTAGLYVFVADNYTVNPTAPSSKPNASTGANDAAAAVVAVAIMAVAAVASKKIVK